MNNDEIWLMSDQSLKSLKQDIKEQKKLGGQREQMAFGDYRMTTDTGLEVLRIHGPIISRPNWITDLLGLRTTEEHMDNLSDMLASGSDVLLDIDTGGGHASLAFEFADMIASGGEQVTAYSGGYAASAGMLFLTAASQSYAHRSATLGSIGVVGYGYFREDDDDGVIYSDNAANKKPNKSSVRRDINETEKLFHEYVERGAGLSREDIITLGRHGDIFTGEYAETNGFIDSTTTLQELTTTTEGGTLPQPKDMQAAMQTAMARVAKCTSIEGVPSDIAQIVAGNLAIDDDAATSLLTAVGKAITTAYDAGMTAGKAEAPAPTDKGDDDKGTQVSTEQQQQFMTMLTQMQAAMSKEVNQVKGDQTDGGELPPEKTEAEMKEEDWKNRLAFISKNTNKNQDREARQ